MRAPAALLAALMMGTAASVASPARADIAHSGDLAWHTLETPHFTIHYHDGLKAVAERSASIAEAAHDDLVPEFGWRPDRPTTIVVTDEIGQANGFATPFPRNQFTVYATPPDDAGTIADHRGWLRTVIRHEYAHILHMDRVDGVPAVLRRIFGRVAFPGAFQPRWALEGLAQKLEARDGTRAGRAQDSATAMYMRMATAAGIDPLDRASHTTASWPGGERPYVYGVAFQNFLADQYGAEARQTWIRAQSAEAIPFRYSPALREATGKDKKALWAEFAAWLRDKHEPTLARRREAGLRNGEAVTSNGELTGRAYPDGRDHIVHISNTRDRPPTLRRRNLATGESRSLGKVRAGARLAVAADRPVLVAQPAACDNARRQYDLYRFSRVGSGGERLTRCGRYRQVAWGADESTAYALRQKGGEPTLVRLAIERGDVFETEILWQGERFTALDSLQLSPDGQRLLAGKWDGDRGWHIAEFDLIHRSWSVLRARQAVEMQPRYGPAGETILYTADYGGIYDIRRLDRASGQVARLTRVAGGAFAPTAVRRRGDGDDLVFLNYGPNGFDLRRRDLGAWAVADELPPQGASAEMPAEASAPSAIKGPEPYSAVSRQLLPAYWGPQLSLSGDRALVGAFTSGSDALNRHNYAVSAGYEFTEGLATASLDYVYDRFFPVPKLSLARGLGYESAAGQVMLPWVATDWRFSLHVGGTLRRPRSSAYTGDRDRDNANQAQPMGVAGVLDTTDRWPKSISASHGRFVTLALEQEDLVGQPDYNGPVAVADYREYLGLGGQHVLHLRAAGGYGPDRPQPFRLGGYTADPPPPGLTSFASRTNPLNRRHFALRGYSSNDQEGNALAMGTAEYRFPIQRIERGVGFMPLGLRKLSGRLALDAGDAWNGKGDRNLHTGSALEALAHLNIGYGRAVGVNMPLRLGVAQGFTSAGATQLYLTLGAPF